MKETWSDTIKQMVKKAGKGKILLLIAVGVLLLLVSIKDSVDRRRPQRNRKIQ